MATQQNSRRVHEERLAKLIKTQNSLYEQLAESHHPDTIRYLLQQAENLEREILEINQVLLEIDISTPIPEAKSKYTIHIENASGLVIGDNATVMQHFSSGSDSAPATILPADNAQLVALADQISRYFDLEETRDLCFRLGNEYDDLRGEGKRGRVRELVRALERNGRLPELLPLLQKLRPSVEWE